MPFPSARTSTTSSKVKKRPMNYEIPNTQNLTAKPDDGKSKLPEVEAVKKPVEKASSTFMSFSIFSGDSVNSTDEEKNIREIPCSEKENFRDFEAGEPSRFQHLKIDFTPIKGVDDDEELQQKCIDFWEFVNSDPTLTKLMAKPVKKTSYDEIDEMLYNVENNNNQNIDVPKAKTALEWTKNLPMLNYLGKLSNKYCPESPSSYKLTSKSCSESSPKMVSKSSTWTMKHKKGTKPKDVSTSAALRSKEDAKKVCEDMDDFDRKHPRCFEPPVRTPTLITAKLQRFLPSLSCAPLSTN